MATSVGLISYSNEFYVYVYYDPKTYIPFYVGKGKNLRWQPRLRHSRQNPFLKNKLQKIGIKNVIVDLVLTNVCEECASCCEIDLINAIGRRDLGLGPLCNLTDGGEGVSGNIPTPVTRRKISESLLGRTGLMRHTAESKRKISIANSGKTFTEEHRRKLSERKIGCIPWNKGKHHSISTRRKLRLAWIKRKERGDVPWNKGSEKELKK